MSSLLPSKPTDRPQWTENSPGQRVVPSEAFRENGWNPNVRPPSQIINWLFFNIGVEWVNYFDASINLLDGAVSGNLGQFDGTIGVNGTDATIPDFIARVRATNPNIEDQRIFVTDPQTLTSTQLIDLPGLEIVYHPRAVTAQGSTLQVGLRIDAPRVKIDGGRFIGFDLTEGSAIELTENAKNVFIKNSLFDENTEDVAGILADTILSNNANITA